MNEKRVRIVDVSAGGALLALTGESPGDPARLIPRGCRLVGAQQDGGWLRLKLWRADFTPVPEGDVIPYYRETRDG